MRIIVDTKPLFRYQHLFAEKAILAAVGIILIPVSGKVRSCIDFNIKGSRTGRFK